MRFSFLILCFIILSFAFGSFLPNFAIESMIKRDISIKSDHNMNQQVDFGYNWKSFEQIAYEFISNRTMPGLTVQVIYGNKTVYQNSIGNQTYPGDAFNSPVNQETIYDIASLSKVFGITSGIMRLYDLGLLNLSDPVATFIPEFNNTGKGKVQIQNLLLHNSGLQADLDLSSLLSLTPGYILDSINHIQLSYPTGTAYVYSDLNMIVLQEVLQRITGVSLDIFLNLNVFHPLEMNSTMFNPSPLFVCRIPPTEYDNIYRHELIHGVVHDETAFFLGGVSGNAGIFSTANDLSKFMNMMLNKGEYVNSNGKKVRIFSEEVVNLFTTKPEGLPYPNSRAYGWDTVPLQQVLPCGTKYSQQSFGHTGFTGTTAWADKEKDLSIVILSNRVYPDRTHSSSAITYFRQTAYTQICAILGY